MLARRGVERQQQRILLASVEAQMRLHLSKRQRLRSRRSGQHIDHGNPLVGACPSSACQHLLPACGEKDVCRASQCLQQGTTSLSASEERVRVRGRQTHPRSEEHTSELQSLMRISYAVFCLKKKHHQKRHSEANIHTTYQQAK